MGVRESVIEIRKSKPSATLREIGDKVGVSGERVRQILKRGGLSTVSKKTTPLKIEIIESNDLPVGWGQKYDHLFNLLNEIDDQHAIRVADFNKGDINRIRFLSKKFNKNIEVMVRRNIMYIRKK